MDIYRVCLFGHREIDDLRETEDRLYKLLKSVTHSHGFTEFFVGRNGEFDELAASVIKRIKKEGSGDIELTLVLPYNVADQIHYERYYDNIVIPIDIKKVHYKRAIEQRNRWMVDNAELVIVAVERVGGAHRAMTYAKKCEKKVINIASVY